MASKLSDDYFRCLNEATAHHASSKTYSGKFLRPHAPAIREIVQRRGVRSILDYGCGKGRQYEWVSHGEDASIPAGFTLETYWGCPVAKYDPAFPPFSEKPRGHFDLVICTHVLGSIPVHDLPTIIGELYGYARRAVYVAEKLGPVRKQVFARPDLMPREWTADDWLSALRSADPRGLEVILATRRVDADGEVITGRVTV